LQPWSTMAALHLSPEQVSILRQALDMHLSELRVEIAGTDKKDFRDDLSHRRQVLEQVAEQLAEVEDAPYPPISGG